MNKIKIMVVMLIVLVTISLIYIFTKENVMDSNIINIEYKEDDIDWEKIDKTYISFSDSSIEVEGEGATVDGSIVTLKSGGSYYLEGTLTNGGVIVDSSDEVYIILNGVDITNETSSAIYIKNAKIVYLNINESTVNTLTDGVSYQNDSSEDIDATIYSKDDLVIMGTGTLNIMANYNHGIHSKDYIQILDGSINIISKNEGIKGKDYVAIKDGNISIKSESDGIQVTNENDSTLGYIVIDGGVFNIDSVGDGISAMTKLSITNGVFNIKTGGGSKNDSTSSLWGSWGNVNDISSKGLKAGELIVIEGGDFEIDTSDDAIHSNNSIVIKDGVFIINSGDDGIHSDTSLIIDGGNIDVKKSYEGIESLSITINDGNINVVASDDGINAAGGNDASSINGRRGQNNISNGSGKIIINGGYVYINSTGDGIDSNGSVVLSDGIVLVDGPTSSGNGALDYDTTFVISGGTLIAAGSSGMSQNPSSTSTQNIIAVNFSSSKSSGEIINITDSLGEEIITYAPSKTYQSVVVSTPSIKNGETYKIYSGGSYSVIPSNGLYTGGRYTGGSLYEEVKVENILTVLGNTMGAMNNMGPHGGRR